MSNKYLLCHCEPFAQKYFNSQFGNNVYDITLCTLKNGNVTVDSMETDIVAKQINDVFTIDKRTKIEILYCCSHKLTMRNCKSGECFSTGQFYFRVTDGDRSYLVDDQYRNMDAFYVRKELLANFDIVATFYKLVEKDIIVKSTEQQRPVSPNDLHFHLKNGGNAIEITNLNGSFDYTLASAVKSTEDFYKKTEDIIHHVLLGKPVKEKESTSPTITANDKVVLIDSKYVATNLSISNLNFFLKDQPYGTSIRYGYKTAIQSGALIYHVISVKVFEDQTYAIITDFGKPNDAPVYIVNVKGLRKVD